ncbi:MAG: DegV family protein [Lachnospiraceae bacterium]|nr:DegV family protein [Lachnospiraceae bacterium]
MAIRLIIDSTADLCEKDAAKLQVVPLFVHFGEEEFLDGVEMKKDEFYKRLVNGDEMPSTSQPSPAVFESVFKEISQNGDSAIVLTLASEFSGTFQSASIAAEEFENVRVIDSRTVAIGTGILASFAVKCIDEGKDLDEICALLEEKREHVRIIALLDTLKYLQKGGRISKTAAFAGNVLNIKPVISISDGMISLLGKARGSRKGNNFLNEEAKKYGIDYSMPILLGYTGCSDDLLQNYIEDSKDLWQNELESLDIAQIGCVVGTHGGPGAIAVAFFDRL